MPKTDPVRRLTCCCCGASTRGRQWWNRGDGFGLCAACVDYCASRMTPEEFRQCYGERVGGAMMPDSRNGAGRLHWRSEFSDAYAVPRKVELLVLDGKLEDTSWHNDAAPSFEREVGGWDVRLWVEHPDADQREVAGKRFLVCASPHGECEPCHELLETDDLDQALTLGGPVADQWARERIADAERRGRIPRADFTDRAGLKRWCEALNAAGLLFHFDDDPVEVVHVPEPGRGSVRTFTGAEAAYLRDVAVPLVFRVAEAGGFDPFEVALECEES